MSLYSKSLLEHIGFLVITIDIDKLIDLYINTPQSEKGEFYILDSNDKLIYNSVPITDKTIDFKYFKNKTNSTEIIDNRLLVYNKSALNNWKYIYEIPEKEILREVLNLRDFMFISLFIIIIIATFCAILIAYNLTKPIYTLINDMKITEKGNFSIRLPVTTSDEIGMLCKNYNIMLSKIESLINKVYKEELSRKNAEINALEAQINPHFLYNTLDSINALAELKRTNEISTITIAFAKLLRLSISTRSFITLVEELAYTLYYIDIINIRTIIKLNFIWMFMMIIKIILSPN